MIDNEKVKKALIISDETPYSSDEIDFANNISSNANNERLIAIRRFYAGYVAGHKEAEDEKREFIEALIQIYKKDWKIGINDICKNLIEKYTRKPIDEVVK